MLFNSGTNRAAAFTVLELLIALAVTAILMGVAVPGFLSWLPALRLAGAARQVATDLQSARMRAISLNTSTTVTFTTSSGTYSFGGDSRNLGQLFPGVTIASASDPTFTPRGTANAVAVELSNGSAQKRICVKAVGRINIQDATC